MSGKGTKTKREDESDILARLGEFLKRFHPGVVSVPFSNRRWNSLRYEGKRLKEHFSSGAYKDLSPGMRELSWQLYKAQCATQGNWLPWLICCIEPQQTGMFERKRPRRPKGSDLFDDLPPAQQVEAQNIYKRLCDDWSWRVRIAEARYAQRNSERPCGALTLL